jgi:molybdopterin-synthase adenylyltransferase
MTKDVVDTEPVYRLRAKTQRMQLEDSLLLKLGERGAKIHPFDTSMKVFLELLAKGDTRTHIREHFLAMHDETHAALADQSLDHLLSAGFIEQVNISSDLDPLDIARFDRLLHFFSEFETNDLTRFDYLARLRHARVTVIGTGGLGSWVIYNLLCCGVGFLRLIDADRVEASNLNRSILFNEDDIGELKVVAAAHAAAHFAPRTRVEGCDLFVSSPETLTPYIQDVDLVIGVADQPLWLIRQWVADACQYAAVPVVQASGLRVGPFYIPGQGSCSMCDWMYLVDQSPRLPAIVESQRNLPKGTTGAVSTIGTITAGVLSLDIFRYLSGYAAPHTLNAIWEMHDNLAASLRTVLPHPRCPICTREAQQKNTSGVYDGAKERK